jgi:hypothetical protein
MLQLVRNWALGSLHVGANDRRCVIQVLKASHRRHAGRLGLRQDRHREGSDDRAAHSHAKAISWSTTDRYRSIASSVICSLPGLNRFDTELVQHSKDPRGDTVCDLQNALNRSSRENARLPERKVTDDRQHQLLEVLVGGPARQWVLFEAAR